ncbi:MAG TPA: ferrochelatase [Acidimicrobiales bacterium]|nr:ferrochelatase [Acidimicrobiales bacterium]
MSPTVGARRRTGVLVMAHGTPADVSGIEAFYTRIRHGRPPTPEQLADLVRRYEAIGGASPLAARTAAQVAGITSALEAAEPGTYVVRFGAKHTAPLIEDAAGDLAASGVGRVVGVVLTPHRASMGSDEYLDRAAAALSATPTAPPLVRVPQWFDAPGFAALVAGRVLATLDEVAQPAGEITPAPGSTTVLFTAHSLPERVLAAGDPYPEQVAASAAAVAGEAGLATRGVSWEVAWQSAGRTDEPWIGPDLLAVVRRLGAEARDRGIRGGVVVCPIGFVTDHLEVLYDVDIEAGGVAEKEGLAFARTASLDDDPRFCAVVAGAVRVARESAAARGSAAARESAAAPEGAG